jgi:hypothetical protein
LATPTFSLAVPLKTIELADVEKVLLAGETIVSEGGVVSGAPGDGGGGGSDGGAAACCRVIVTLWATTFCVESLATIVMTFAPTLRGTDGIVQVVAAGTDPRSPDSSTTRASPHPHLLRVRRTN